MEPVFLSAVFDIAKCTKSRDIWSTLSGYLEEFSGAEFLRVIRRKGGMIEQGEVHMYDTTDRSWRKHYNEMGFQHADPLALLLPLKRYELFCWDSSAMRALRNSRTEFLEREIRRHGDHTGAFGAHIPFPTQGYTISTSSTYRLCPKQVEKRVTEHATELHKLIWFTAMYHEKVCGPDTPVASHLDRLIASKLLNTGLSVRELENSGMLQMSGGDFSSLLTPRQRSCLLHVARGETSKAIAYQLGVKERTVNLHISEAMRKLGARNRTEAALMAVELGLLGAVNMMRH